MVHKYYPHLFCGIPGKKKQQELCVYHLGLRSQSLFILIIWEVTHVCIYHYFLEQGAYLVKEIHQ